MLWVRWNAEGPDYLILNQTSEKSFSRTDFDQAPSTLKKTAVSFFLGLMGFCGAFYSLHFAQGKFSISIVWSQAFPLIASLAYGEKYGFIAGTIGLGALFPFFIWSNNGWANVVTSLGYLMFYIWQGYFARKRKICQSIWNNPLIVQIPFSFFYAAMIYFFYPVAFSYNPPSWAPLSQISMPSTIISGIAFKSPVIMYFMTLFSAFILLTPEVQSRLGFSVKPETRNNGLIFIATILSSFAVCFLLLAFNRIFLEEDFSFSTFFHISPYEITALVVIINSGFLAGYVITQFLEKRYSAEDVLRESEIKYRRLHESMNDCFVQTTMSGKIVDLNKSFLDLIGYTREEALSLTYQDITPKHWHELEKKLVETQILVRGYSDVYQKEYIKKDGTVFPVELKTFLLRDTQGLGIYMWAIVRDITERKRIEEERLKIQKLQSVGNLAGGIAHDFNNFLTGMYGNISLAKIEISPEHPAFSFLENAEKSMDRATSLTKQLLTFAKGGEPVKENIRIGSLVEETVRFDLSGSNVMLIFKQPEDLWSTKVDKGQIQQVLSNITINAKQAMPNGGRLYVTLENIKIEENSLLNLSTGNYIKITIKDEGPGIDQKNLDQIFDPYFTTKKCGSGLGLATSHSIINKHEGTITVESKLGQGATFTVYLPTSDSNKSSSEQELSSESCTINQIARILLMDDEEMIRNLGSNMLRKIGYMAETASDGREVINKFKQAIDEGKAFSVIIMDLTVPGGIGGKEAIKEILSIDPKTRVIVSSGYADDPVMANFKAYGFKGILPKPYTIQEMQNVVTRILKKENGHS
ncbi:MAG: PAS domain S-box protein [Candidatus Riflebacteria bacterium]|nr:PAS domain S-box protein [Candidatus Riflebacteria bacterium]